MRPLGNLLVLDFSTLLPGPLAALWLAEAGAKVIKIERPGPGEDMRRYDPPWGANSGIFALLNRGKHGLALDLTSAADRDRLRPLIEQADVIIEQFRPGVMARFGLDYENVAAINSKAVYCSISAYGQTGPKRSMPGHDLNIMAETGLLALSMSGSSDPVMPPTPIADIAGGAYPAALNILLALQERSRTGRGRHIDISISDNVFVLGYWALAHGWVTGQWPGNRSDLVTGSSPRYRLYGTRDGKVVAAAPLEPKFWENFCNVIGLGRELRDDQRDPAATISAISQIIAAESSQTWAARFRSVECCCSIVEDLQTAVSDPHFKARGLFDHVLSNEQGVTIPALPVPVDPAFRAPPGTNLTAPPVTLDVVAVPLAPRKSPTAC
jgi:alpha-methylacyl-CoA racemase